METQFLITLKSGKKINNFTLDLCKTFELQDEWEVGLAEISYPKTWLTLPYKQYVEYIYYNPNGDLHIAKSEKAFIRAGNYTTDELIEEINEALESLEYVSSTNLKIIKGIDHIECTKKSKLYREKSNIVCDLGYLNKQCIAIPRFSSLLGNLLGFNRERMTEYALQNFRKYIDPTYTGGITDKVYVDYDYYIHKYLESFHVCTDLIHKNYINKNSSNVLREVIINNDKDLRQINTKYDRIYYYPLKYNVFNKINIQIKNKPNGYLIPFTCGQVQVILHFRKVSNIIKILTESEQKPESDPDVEIMPPKKPILPNNPNPELPEPGTTDSNIPNKPKDPTDNSNTHPFDSDLREIEIKALKNEEHESMLPILKEYDMKTIIEDDPYD